MNTPGKQFYERPEIDPDPTHAYVVRRSCGHPVALYVDDATPSLGREIAKDIGAGRTVERVTIAEARVIGVQYCDCPLTPREELARKRARKADRKRSRR